MVYRASQLHAGELGGHLVELALVENGGSIMEQAIAKGR